MSERPPPPPPRRLARARTGELWEEPDEGARKRWETGKEEEKEKEKGACALRNWEEPERRGRRASVEVLGHGEADADHDQARELHAVAHDRRQHRDVRRHAEHVAVDVLPAGVVEGAALPYSQSPAP